MRKSTILTDEVIRLTGVKAAAKYPSLFRRIEFYDAQQARTFEFLTNTMKLGATTIAAIYKDLWQIELFFKALKQNRIPSGRRETLYRSFLRSLPVS